ncbi:MAG: IS1634 family transposase [Deltaproteobacteria bacterium]|nr:IS1634 family transposase [Deltaproteobacteria bacterium]
MTDNLNLESLCIGGHPLIQPFLDRLDLRAFLEEALGKPDPRIKLPPVDAAMLLVRNFTLSRHPMYGVPEWARRFDPEQLELEANQMSLINDDRLGRVLDKLFLADRRSMMTRLVIHMVEKFKIDLKRLHNDSTSLTFSGEYRERPPRKPDRPHLRIVHGHNKDHRPDLKQIVWSLTVSDDGAVPVHYNVYDGNTVDDTTHVGIWDSLNKIVGGPEFIYVADCKLCTRKNMAHINGPGGRFITVLPRTRKEDGRFKEWILHNKTNWRVIWNRPHLRRKNDPPECFEAVEDPSPSAEGYRIIWYRSSEKWKRDERSRYNAIQAARQELHRLGERAGKRQLKTRDQVQAAVDKILDDTGTRPWVRVEIETHEKVTHKQIGRGRPGKNTRYARQVTSVYRPAVALDDGAIKASAAADGIFPLITNLPADQMSPLDVLSIYKYQPFIEKRHEQLKTAAEVVPVNFKTPERIEAYLFLYFIAVTVHALIERTVRDAMQERGIKSIPLYPEERACRAPTADKIMRLFEQQRRHRLFDGDRVVKTFWDPLSNVQKLVLDLLNIPPTKYR